jgi:hypothetical protein
MQVEIQSNLVQITATDGIGRSTGILLDGMASSFMSIHLKDNTSIVKESSIKAMTSSIILEWPDQHKIPSTPKRAVYALSCSFKKV